MHLLLGYSPGGAVDTLAQLLAAPLQATLGRAVVVDHRPGLGSNLAIRALVDSPPDGSRLMLATNALAANCHLYRPAPYTLDRIAPVALVGRVPVALAVPAASPLHSVQAFIAQARARPGALHLGNPGNGSTPHLAMALFERVAGLRLRHVPYKGGPPALADAIDAHLDGVAVNALELVPHVAAGRLRVLAVLTAQRSPVFPEAPTIAESGHPGFDAAVWYGLVAPAGTAPERLDQLHRAVQLALRDGPLRHSLAQAGGSTTPGPRAAFARLLSAESGRWQRLIETTGIRVD